MSAIISLSSGKARVDLIVQYGQGTENPSVMLINHSGEEQIELGDINRFTDEEPMKSERTAPALPQTKIVTTVEAKPS
jgi:hypothetical protein